MERGFLWRLLCFFLTVPLVFRLYRAVSVEAALHSNGNCSNTSNVAYQDAAINYADD